jgi:hypothetical protein
MDEWIKNGVLFDHKAEQNYVICKKMDGTGWRLLCYVKKARLGKTIHVFSHMQKLD